MMQPHPSGESARKSILKRPVTAAALVAAVAVVVTTTTPAATQDTRRRPLAILEPAPALRFPAPTDSNSPAFWFLFRGMLRLAVFNSSPDPIVSVGSGLDELMVLRQTTFNREIGGARWIEAVVPDEAGRLYGYYHTEPAGVCAEDPTKTTPRIGAARSLDGGRTWWDLGIILAAAPGEPDCATPNRYFAGGVGDFSVLLDRSGTDLYFLYSSYGPDIEEQGIAAGRMRWSDRDAPRGQVTVWSAGAWRYPVAEEGRWIHPAPTPIFPASVSWHSRRRAVDAFWGPSLHWNTFLNRYVMLLNRAADVEWEQEGIYISASLAIEDPSSWSTPQKLLDGGRWYPQVMGLEPGSGTDKLAGERARFFMGGESSYEIVFQPRGEPAVRR